MNDYLSLFITFVGFILITIVLTYTYGVVGGGVGCILFSLHNVWASNLILAQRFRAGLVIFFQNMMVAIPIMLFLNHVFYSIKIKDLNIAISLAYLSAAVMIFFLVVRWHDVVNFSLTEYLTKKKQSRNYKRSKREEETGKKIQRQELQRLESLYQAVDGNTLKLDSYHARVDRLIKRSKYANNYSKAMAFFTSKLMVKGLDSDDRQFALSVFNHYIDKIFPYTGSCDYETNIIGNSLVLAIKYNMDDVAKKVFAVLLGQDFDIQQIKNNLVLYNLACYYALNGEKQKMLEAVQQGILHGKDPEQYRQDQDFSDYWQDDDFLKLLA